MLYNKYLKMHVKTAFQYKVNMIFLGIAQSVVTVAEILSVYILFRNFRTVSGWGFYETALMYGLITASYSLMECFGRGFDEFHSLVQAGELDRYLVRPVNIIFQLFGAKIEFTKLSRVIIGVVVMIIALVNLSIIWTFTKVLVLISAFICGVVFVWSTFLIAAGVSIFTVERPEFLNIITNGMKEVTYYPLNVYKKWMVRFFTFIIPLASFNYLPVSYIMGYGNLTPVIYAISPLLGMLFVVPSLLFFLWSLKKYESTGN